MAIVIGLAGNPNSGKTTLFNELTGSSAYVGNWPGVTVEKKEGKLKGYQDVTVVDLPGIYSLSPYTPEEIVTRTFLLNDQPDVIINLVDASNLERNLYLTTQLMEVGIPVVIALNMMDIVAKYGDSIDVQALSKQLQCSMIELSALKGTGLPVLMKTAVETAKQYQSHKINTNNENSKYDKSSSNKDTSVDREHESDVTLFIPYSIEVEDALAKIKTLISNSLTDINKRFFLVKVFERDAKIIENFNLDHEANRAIESIIKDVEAQLDDDSESIITTQRYHYIEQVLSGNYVRKYRDKMTPSDKIDHIVTNRWLALPIFAFVMFAMYYVSVTTIGTFMTDWVNDVLFGSIIPPFVENFLVSMNTADWLVSLVIDGILAGVGGVLGFLPQMMVLFLFLAMLEDVGYMARIAFILDRLFRKFGLSGKSFIPMLIGTGCSVPGIMASRTIESENDRRMTIITTSFIPCSAKLPIIALIAGAMFPGSSWVGPSAYFAGIAAIIMSGIILKKTKWFAGDPAPFVMELPAYHLPALKSVMKHTWDRAEHFIEKAGTVILLSSVSVWFLSNYSWTLQIVAPDHSILASLGNLFAPLFSPLGWGDWKAAVATFTGLIAKENVVGTLGVLSGLPEVAEDGIELWGSMRLSFTSLSAYSFLIFNLLCAPCFATVGAIRSEMKSAKWTWFAVGYQTGLAYVISLIIYQLGTFISLGTFTITTAVAIILAILTVYLLMCKPSKKPQENKSKKTMEVTA